MHSWIAPSVASLCLAGTCAAQSFNIDIGNATPTPSSSFGAAAGQAGVWNTYVGGTLNGLFDTGGNATAVSMSGTSGGFLGSFSDPTTFGDDDALMDDGMLIPFFETYTVSGLAAGSYSIYYYVWTVSPLPTGLDINGQGMQTIGGSWPGGYVAGTTHAVTSVQLTSGQDLVIDVHSINGALGSFTGLQIVPVPAPGAGALGAAALLGLGRGRRRR